MKREKPQQHPQHLSKMGNLHVVGEESRGLGEDDHENDYSEHPNQGINELGMARGELSHEPIRRRADTDHEDRDKQKL